MKSNGNRLYVIKHLADMMDMLERRVDIPSDIKSQFTQYDMYEEVCTDSANGLVTLRHLQLHVDIKMSISLFNETFKEYKSKEVILKPIAELSDIRRFLLNECSVENLDEHTGFIVKVDMEEFTETQGDISIKVQYSNKGFKFRRFVQVIRMVDKHSLLKKFKSPNDLYISDMNMFDKVKVSENLDNSFAFKDTLNEHNGLVYFYGYSTSEGYCRVIKDNVDKNAPINIITPVYIIRFKHINIFLGEPENKIKVDVKKESDGGMNNKFAVVNTKQEIVYPKSVGEGLVVTFKGGTVHMLINNLSLVDKASFKVIEVGERGKVGVWGSGFESMGDYYTGLDRLKLQISRIDKLTDFSLVNKALLN